MLVLPERSGCVVHTHCVHIASVSLVHLAADSDLPGCVASYAWMHDALPSIPGCIARPCLRCRPCSACRRMSRKALTKAEQSKQGSHRHCNAAILRQPLCLTHMRFRLPTRMSITMQASTLQGTTARLLIRATRSRNPTLPTCTIHTTPARV